MKIKLLFFALFLSGNFLNAQNENTNSGWEEGVAAVVDMIRMESKESSKVFVGNLAAFLKEQGGKSLVFYANDKKNIWVVMEAEVMQSDTFQYSLTKGLKKELRKNRKLKAFIYKGVTRVVNGKGEVVKTIGK